jgi:hypothetical protein
LFTLYEDTKSKIMARKEEARRLPLKMTKSVSIWNF